MRRGEPGRWIVGWGALALLAASMTLAPALTLAGPAGGGVALAASEAGSGSGEQQALVVRGRNTFRVYCASCHGVGAAGDGKLADSLRTRPADLTLLARRAGGAFPAEKVQRRIDGREEVEGHGASDMPVWGYSFQNPESDQDQEAEVKAKLRAIVAFLETVQKK